MSSDLMKGKTCMITGANSGIGKATALGLAKLGVNLILVCRNTERGEPALKEIMQKSGNRNVSLLTADLSSQMAIRELVRGFLESHQKLDVLINNAGVFLMSRNLTEDGIEATFAVNHLAPFLLTNLLLDTLTSSAPSRIVTVASDSHEGQRMNFDDLQGERHYSGFRAYGQSKLANIMFTYELARRVRGAGVTANCLHPGAVRTNLLRQNSLLIRGGYRLASLFFSSPAAGAQTPLYLASSEEVEEVSGRYFAKKREVPSSPESYDEDAGRRLWEVSAQLTHLIP